VTVQNRPTLARPKLPPEEEAAYREFRIQQIGTFERLAALAGAASVIAFIWWDDQFSGVAMTDTLYIRIGLALLLLGLFAITFTRLGRRHEITQPLATLILIGGFSWVLTRLPEGFNMGVGGLALGIALLPMLAYRLEALVGLCVVAIVMPNLFLTTTAADRFTYVNMNVWLLLAGALAVGFWLVLDAVNRRLFLSERDLRRERARADNLLENMLPTSVADRLKSAETNIAERFDSVTVLFADIVGFTAYARTHEPVQLVELLNSLFSRFDDLVDGLGLEKIKTIGDGYMVAAGVPVPRPDHAPATAELALMMMAETESFCRARGVDWELRIGIHTGQVVAGVIGKKKYAYDLWGDAVNVASRVESTSEAGSIQVTEATVHLLADRYTCEPRGMIELKNRGPMRTFFLTGRRTPATETASRSD
jgi:class 3 adenylate cyclase